MGPKSRLANSLRSRRIYDENINRIKTNIPDEINVDKDKFSNYIYGLLYNRTYTEPKTLHLFDGIDDLKNFIHTSYNNLPESERKEYNLNRSFNKNNSTKNNSMNRTNVNDMNGGRKRRRTRRNRRTRRKH
jgi:hypothetical protein